AGSNYTDFVWLCPNTGNYTPGGFNVDQTLADIGLPDFGDFWIISTMGDHGLQNYSAASPLAFQVEAGGSIQIVYTADAWYRISALLTNTMAVLEAEGESNYIWTVNNVQGNISNHVVFTEWQHPYSNATTAWLSQWSEAQVANGDGDTLSPGDEFLLNTDPTATTAHSFAVTSIVASNNQVAVAVKLTRDTVVTGFNDGDINGTLYLYGTSNLLNTAFTEIAGTAVNGMDFGNDGNEHTYVFPGAPAAATFYRAVIK
ncbi:MAG: hypothetical protein PHR35_02180, partial [Kiritimatiellae bacterium]|nr:hypothetical protein [Kiritimatiellia bacterium]